MMKTPEWLGDERETNDEKSQPIKHSASFFSRDRGEREISDEKLQPMNDFRFRLKTFLRKNGLTYEKFAQKIGVEQTTVRNWMSSKPIPKAMMAIINAEYLEKDSLTMSSRWMSLGSESAPAAPANVQAPGQAADEEMVRVHLSPKLRAAMCAHAEELGISFDRLVCRIVEDEAIRIFRDQQK